jgi:hypothetical protein
MFLKTYLQFLVSVLPPSKYPEHSHIARRTVARCSIRPVRKRQDRQRRLLLKTDPRWKRRPKSK